MSLAEQFVQQFILDDFRRLAFVEMAMDRIPDLSMKAGQVICFCHDIHAGSTRDKSTLGRFFYDEMDFGHLSVKENKHA